MAKKKKKNQQPAEQEIVNVSKAEQFVEKNIKQILIGVVGILALVILGIGVSHGSKRKEKKAQIASVAAQQAFQNRNWNFSLDGDENNLGFVELAKQYRGTKIGNTSHYYAGVSYMKLQKYEEAAHEFSKFKATNDPNVTGLAYMNHADALSELDKMKEAIQYYKKAANTPSEAFQPEFMLRYALALHSTDDLTTSKSVFEKIAKDFPNTYQGNTAEQFLKGL